MRNFKIKIIGASHSFIFLADPFKTIIENQIDLMGKIEKEMHNEKVKAEILHPDEPFEKLVETFEKLKMVARKEKPKYKSWEKKYKYHK